jgi:hypothetical protein
MPDSGLLSAALDYARRGYKVIPLHTPDDGRCSCRHPDCDRQGKHPRTKRGVLDATTDEGVIRSWWWSWPDANIGLAMGGGRCAVDVDSWAALEVWEAEHGALPAGPRQTTGRGEHRLCSCNGGIRNRVRFAPGLDIRSDGGYIVVAPSLHVSGKRYEWDPDHTLDEPLPPLPASIATLCAEQSVTSAQQHQPIDPALVLSGVAEGERNDTLFRYACRLYGVNKLSPVEVRPLVWAAGKSCKPPVSDAELITILRSASKHAPDATEEAPVPLGPAPPPLFPPDALPEPLRSWAREVAESVQIPYCAVSALALSALSVCTCRRVRVQLPTHSEWTNTYMVIALPPGARKSTAFELAFRPVVEMEREWQEKLRPEVEMRRDMRKAEEARIARWEKQAGTASSETDRQNLIESIANARAAMTTEVVMPKLWVGGDITQERLAQLLEEQHERLAILDAEGTLFDLIAGRYSATGKSPSFDLLLKAWRGDAHRVERVGRDPIQLRAPLLTLCLATQPSVVEALAEHREFRGRGLLGRMLFCLPPSLVGTRLYHDRAPAQDVLLEYRSALRDVWRATWADEVVLKLENEALDVWRAFYDDLERRQAAGGDLEELREHASKLAGTVAGIAGSLHMLRHRAGQLPGLISESDARSAVAIGHWALGHAIVAGDMIGMSPDKALARRILDRAKGRGIASFTSRDVLRWFRDVDSRSVDSAIAALTSRGLVRENVKTGPKGGRPSRCLEIV